MVRISLAALCALSLLVGLGLIQHKDEEVKRQAAATDLIGRCQIQQYNTLHEFDCKIISKQLAVIKL